jgi:DNA repair protein RecN (Recombination protein N)
MLERLKIKNLALIEDMSLEIESGLNVLTGETGAGKSIIIAALNMVLGESVGKEIVSAGEDSCEVEAVFDLSSESDIISFLESRDLGAEELIIRRKYYAKGSSKCFINDHSVTMAALKELGNMLVDIHSQNQHQTLLQKSNQMKLLDRFSGNESVLADMKISWEEYNALKKKMEDIVQSKDVTEREIERLKYEIEEIDSLELYEGISEEVERQYQILSNSETLYSGIEGLYSQLYEKDASLMDNLVDSVKKIEELKNIDPDLKSVYENLDEAVYEIESACEVLRTYRNDSNFEFGDLDEVIKLREKLSDLKRKYGEEIKDILSYRDDMSRRIYEFENFDATIKKLESDIKKAGSDMESLADRLTASRKKSADKLSKSVKLKLNKLGMKDAGFEVRLEPCGISGTGREKVEFYISPNPGYPAMELSKIASGGEVSRTMLALKSALAENDRVPILVFDEIDTGIGATIANPVGKELKNLSEFHQIIVITHLPQIAGVADVHIKVEKKVENQTKKTNTWITRLDNEERVKEIARMFGDEDDQIANIHARKILEK